MQNLDMKDWHQLMSVNLNWIVYTPQEAELQWQEHKFTEFERIVIVCIPYVKYVKKLRMKDDIYFLDIVARSKWIDFEVDTRAL